MLESIRTHSRWLLGFVLLLIIPSFIFFGVDGYSRMNEGGNATVAKVDGRKLTQAEWDFAHGRTVDNLRQRMPGADASLFDSPAFKRESLDALVRERVLLAAANDAHLFPTDERLQRLFVTDPQFAQLRNPDGSVRRELLAAQGLTDEDALVRRAAADALGQHPHPTTLPPLLDALRTSDPGDAYLRHVLKLALRNHLRTPTAFAVLEDRPWRDSDRRLLADIALAVPTSAASSQSISPSRAKARLSPTRWSGA